MNARSGSSRECRNPTNPPMARSSSTASPAVSSVTVVPSPSVTVSPSIVDEERFGGRRDQVDHVVGKRLLGA